MKSTKRSLSLSLALLIVLLGAFTACGGSSDTSNETDAAAVTEPVETAPETTIYDDLDLPDLGGCEFRILNNFSDFAYTTMEAEGETGEPLNDAVFTRNRETESVLNIKLHVEEDDYNGVIAQLKDQVLSGDHNFDLFFDETGQYLGQGVFNTLLADMSDVSTIHYDRPWWNDEAMDSVQIGKGRYYLYSDMHMMQYESYATIMYNKNIAATYNMPNFYDVVNEGKWTLDVLKEYIIQGTADLDGDGVMTIDDQFGIGYHQACNPGFFVTSGEPLIQKDTDGKPVWNGLTNRMVDIYDKAVNCLFGLDGYTLTKRVNGYESGCLEIMFANGQMLFFLEPLGSMKVFRDVEFEMGLLPLPKYDEEQDRYYSYITYLAAAGVVPITEPELERTGTILETLAAYSHKYLRPAYFDITLDFKYIQDQESQEILSSILSAGQFDLSALYDWGQLGTNVNNLIYTPTTTFVSTIEKIEKSIQSDIQTTLEAVGE